MMTPQPRTCVGCRTRDDRHNMVRVVSRESALVIDPKGAMEGRGAWVHPVSGCLERALRTRAFERALRVVVLNKEAAEGILHVSDGQPFESLDEKAGRNPMGTR